MTTPRITRRRLLAIGAAFPAAGLVVRTAFAHDGHDHGVATPDASPVATPEVNTGTGAVYLTISNGGSDADTLLSAHTDAAQKVELHGTTMEGDVMKMVPMPEGVEIPAGGTFTFAPQGDHLMLVNLNHDLKPNSSFDLTLTFAKAGDVTIEVPVQTEAPDAEASPETVGDITISGAWSRPAPMITGSAGHDHGGMDHGATPEATPGS